MDVLGYLIPLFFFAIMGLIFYIAHIQAKKRRQDMERIAGDLGFSFMVEDPSMDIAFNFFKVFTKGHSRKFENVLTGSLAGASITVSDYTYVTGHGKNRSVHQQTVFIVQDPVVGLPNTLVRRESPLLDAIGKWFGGQDIDFPEDPAFSGAFVVQGMDEPAARLLFTPEVRELFLRHHSANIYFEAWGDAFLLHFSRRIPAGDISACLDAATDFLSVFRRLQPCG